MSLLSFYEIHDKFGRNLKDMSSFVKEFNGQKTKKMPGLVVPSQTRLRGDDCMKYRPGKPESANSTGRVYEVFAVATIVGGTIGIPMQEGVWINWQELSSNFQLSRVNAQF